jgi:hypothetical protein
MGLIDELTVVDDTEAQAAAAEGADDAAEAGAEEPSGELVAAGVEAEVEAGAEELEGEAVGSLEDGAEAPEAEAEVEPGAESEQEPAEEDSVEEELVAEERGS